MASALRRVSTSLGVCVGVGECLCACGQCTCGRVLSVKYRGLSPTRGSSFFLGKMTALGVLCCFALLFIKPCLLLSSFFLIYHFKTCTHVHACLCVCIMCTMYMFIQAQAWSTYILACSLTQSMEHVLYRKQC